MRCLHANSANGCPRRATTVSIFITGKKAFVLKKHYQVHTKTNCPRDGAPLQYRKHVGKAGRGAFFCEVCQRLYRAEDA